MYTMTYLILAEKPSAAKNFAKALGGMTGTYNGQPYQIQALFGHMLEYVEPHEMVSEDLQEDFKSWDPVSMPWDITQLNWKKQPQKSRNMRTGNMTSKAKAIKDVKDASQGKSAVVIATDKDPSGEGQLIGWEVIQAIGWKGDVKRLYFTDESEKELQNGFKNMVDLPAYNKDGEYVKADVRSRWDFISMQLTRLSTHAARSKGYGVNVVRQGRLKSVMTKLVADQLALTKAYKKKPYYEVKYKDDNGNTYTRKFEDGDNWRFDAKADADKDLTAYKQSDVVVDSTTRKSTAPGKLLDLGGLASILGTKGHKSKDVLSTYQKMYEAGVVSYPRTEDKFISTEQFNEMLPLIDRIAGVVGADVSLLTHRQARKTHVKNGGAHGANRPGLTVPASLSAVASTYGATGQAIYELLAKNFLAMFGEDYEYDSTKAHVKEHPAFTSTINIPVKMGFKAIFDTEDASKDESDESTEDSSGQGVGKLADPFVAEGVNKKPPHPTHKWLEKQLSRYDVGTGATRVSTLTDVTNGKAALLTDTRGKLDLTRTGDIAAALLEGTQIANPTVTAKLFKSMNDVGVFKVEPQNVVQTASDLVKHDKEQIYRNAERLHASIGAPTKEDAANQKQFVKKEKASGMFVPVGEVVQFNRVWGGHRFTDDEITSLLNGEFITIKATTTTGSTYSVAGSLQQGEYKGRSFWGFTQKSADAYTIEDAPFPATWSGHTFTQEEEAILRTGKSIEIDAISKANKPYTVEVSFGISEYNNRKSWKIIPNFNVKRVPDSWSGYTFTPDDKDKLLNGDKIDIKAVSAKTGKPFDVAVSFGESEYKGVVGWRIIPHFEKRDNKDASKYTRENAPFKQEFSGYKLTPQEVSELRAGHKVTVTATSAKSGKKFTCNLSLELKTYKGSKFWGLETHFD